MSELASTLQTNSAARQQRAVAHSSSVGKTDSDAVRISAQTIPFMVCDENRAAFSAIENLSVNPLRGSTPATQVGLPRENSKPPLIFITGKAGTGKTHLCELLRLKLTDSGAGDACLMSGIELNQLLNTVNADFDEANVAIDKIREFRLVIIDGLKQATKHLRIQKSLCNLLDDLAREGIAVVITSVGSLTELHNLEPRLIDRLRAGLAVSLAPLGQSSREQLLVHFCTHLQIAVPTPVLRAFARELDFSPRELLGVLLRFEEFARMERQPADLSFARRFLQAELRPKAATIDSIAKAVAKEFGVRLADMKSSSREQRVMIPRQCAMYLAREILREQFTKIGRYFGNRSHSTVQHAINRIEVEVDQNPSLSRQLNSARRSI